MRDIASSVREYYDSAAAPVTADEILMATPAAPSRRPVENWAVAVAVAVGLVVVVGVASLLIGGSGESVPPATRFDGHPFDNRVTSTSMEPSSTTPTVSVTSTVASMSLNELPIALGLRDWQVGIHESVGYSCDGTGNPDVDCHAPHVAQFSHVWVGYDDPGLPVDFIDFFGTHDPEGEPFPPDSPYSNGSLVGPVNDEQLGGLGHGIRMKQLKNRPPGLDIGGEAWIRLTISSLSATDRAVSTEKLVPTEIGYRIEPNSKGDPLAHTGTWNQTHFIESIVLVATNETMSEWIISFNQPGTYAYTALYWGQAPDRHTYAININFARL